MSTLELNGKDFATQTSSAEPVLASTVTGGEGLMGGPAYVFADYQTMYYSTATTQYSASLDEVDLTAVASLVAGTNHLAITTGSSTSDLLEFICDFGRCYNDLDGTSGSGVATMGFGLERSAATSFTSPTTMFSTSSAGWGGRDFDNNNIFMAFTKILTVAEWGLAASTSYKIRLIGFTGSSAGTFVWGQTGGDEGVNEDGVRITYRRWKVV